MGAIVSSPKDVQYSVVVPGSEATAERTAVRRHYSAVDGLTENLSSSPVERLALEVGSGLLNGDMVPQRTFDSGTGKSLTLRCIGIFAKNREEWVITEHACNAYGFTVVPLYDTLGPHSTRFILEETQMKSVVCDDSCLAKLLDALQEDLAGNSGESKTRLPVKFIIALDEIPEDQKKQAADLNLDLVPWEGLLVKVGH
ncbi:hypothetical protein Emag_004703 [Eimeria magna]